MHRLTQPIHSILLIAWLISLLASCSRSTPTSLIEPLPTIPSGNPIETVPCPFTTSSGVAITCGKLAVPEDYKDPAGAQLHLLVATVHTSGTNPAKDPVIALLNDPGTSFARMMQYIEYIPVMAEILKERDLIFYDMRGVGYSEPGIVCPDVVPAQYANLEKKMSRESRAKANSDVLLACRQKLVQSGIHLENFTTAQNVADLNAVSTALGVAKVNFLALGYGAYLAMRVMQDYPAGIRSALLSSPYNGQIMAYDAAARLERALNLMFESCKSNQSCNRAYPSLKEGFYAAVEELNRNPVEVSIYGSEFINSRSVKVVVTGDEFLSLAFDLLSRSDVSQLPGLVYSIKTDRAYMLTTPFQNLLGYLGYTNPAISTSVYCQAYLEVMVKPPEKGQSNPSLRDWQRSGEQTDELTCADWFTGKTEPSENPGRLSSIPALVITGEWNSYVPPEWVKENIKSLSGAKLVEVVNSGWLFFDGGCITGLALAFLEDPAAALDDSCAKETPAVIFDLPLN